MMWTDVEEAAVAESVPVPPEIVAEMRSSLRVLAYVLIAFCAGVTLTVAGIGWLLMQRLGG